MGQLQAEMVGNLLVNHVLHLVWLVVKVHWHLPLHIILPHRRLMTWLRSRPPS